MTSLIPILAILIMVIINHSTDSGAVSESNPHKDLQFRMSRSFENSKNKKHKSSAVPGQKQMELKHCDYIDLVEVGYREDSTCKPGDKVIFKVSFALARF